MDVKISNINGFIYEQVIVKQPPGFENPKFPYHVLYYHDRLRNFLTNHGFIKLRINTTFLSKELLLYITLFKFMSMILFLKVLMPIYAKKFSKLMQSELEMSTMGELKIFLRLQIH